jgi:putative flippase GtrA
MARAPRLAVDLGRLIRYYGAGVVNTAFGYGLFALMLALGLNLYAAQLAAHVLGVAFNYLTYSRHVFKDAGPAKARFLTSYVVNYFAGLAVLWLVARIVHSTYLAGAISVVIVSILNYFVLSRLVFSRRAAG